jgi:hypothetical protein
MSKIPKEIPDSEKKRGVERKLKNEISETNVFFFFLQLSLLQLLYKSLYILALTCPTLF